MPRRVLLSKVPWPIWIFGSIILFLVLHQLLAEIYVFLFVTALLVWTLVGITLLYSGGILPNAVRWPIIGSLVCKLVGTDPHHRQGNNTVPSNSINRRKMASEAERRIRSLLGNHPAIKMILEDTLPFALKRAQAGARNLGAKRAWIGIFYGPRGVGKSELALAVAELFIGLEVVENATPVFLSVSATNRSDVGDVIRATLLRGLRGVVIIDNADWLADPDKPSQQANSLFLLKIVSELAATYPGQICLLIALTTEQKEKAFNVVAAKEVLRRFDVEYFECDPLDNDSLYQLFSKYLARENITLDQEAVKSLQSLIRRQQEYEGQFDNAEAMHRLSARLIRRAIQAGRTNVTSADIRALEQW